MKYFQYIYVLHMHVLTRDTSHWINMKRIRGEIAKKSI